MWKKGTWQQGTQKQLRHSIPPVFTEDLPLATPDPEISGKAWSKQALPLSEENQVRKH